MEVDSFFIEHELGDRHPIRGYLTLTGFFHCRSVRVFLIESLSFEPQIVVPFIIRKMC